MDAFDQETASINMNGDLNELKSYSSDSENVDHLLNSLKDIYHRLLNIDDFEFEDKIKLQSKVRTLQWCFQQLLEQNEFLVTTVSELEREASQRVLQMEKRLHKSAKTTMEAVVNIHDCEEEMRRLVTERLHVESVFEEVQHQLTVLKVENGYLRDQNANLHHDINALLHVIQQARSTGNWEMDSMTFCEVTPEQVFGPIHSVSQRTSLESLNLNHSITDSTKTNCYMPSEDGYYSLSNYSENEKCPSGNDFHEKRLQEDQHRLRCMQEETNLQLLQKDKVIASLESQIAALNHEFAMKEAECERLVLELAEYHINNTAVKTSFQSSCLYSPVNRRLTSIENLTRNFTRKDKYNLKNKTSKAYPVQHNSQNNPYHIENRSDEWRTDKAFTNIEMKESLDDIKKIKRTKSESFLASLEVKSRARHWSNYTTTIFTRSLPFDIECTDSLITVCDKCSCCMLPSKIYNKFEKCKSKEKLLDENKSNTVQKNDCSCVISHHHENEKNPLFYCNGSLSTMCPSEPFSNQFLHYNEEYPVNLSRKRISTMVQTDEYPCINQAVQTPNQAVCIIPTQTDMTEMLNTAENESEPIDAFELQQQINYYKEQVQRAEDRATSKEMLISQLQSHLQTIITEVQLKDQALNNVERKLNSSRKECSTLQEQITKSEEKVENLMKELKEKEVADNDMTIKMDAQNTKLDEMHEREMLLQEQKRCLMIQLDQQGEELFKTRDELQTTAKHLTVYEKEIEQLNTTVHTLQTAIVQSRRSLDEARKLNEKNMVQSKYYQNSSGARSIGSLIMDV